MIGNNNIKISQIIESQLPEFISDSVGIYEGKTVASSSNGTYVRIGRTVTITSINHGLSENINLEIDYFSGLASSGFYSVNKIIDNDTFTVIDSASGSTNGSLNYNVYGRDDFQETTTIVSEANTYDRFIQFLKQYYRSQEFTGGSVDIIDNFQEYISLDNLVPESIIDSVTLSQGITDTSDTIFVNSTKGFPDKYGLLKINDEIITYISKTSTSFLGCIRGFSGITNYHQDSNFEELVFSESDAASHNSGEEIQNLSVLFLKEFFNNLKYSITPGLESKDFTPDLNIGNFLKESRSLYETKGTEESFKILFKVLFGSEPKIIDLEQYLIKSSYAKYIRREVAIIDSISGNPLNLIGQSIFKSDDTDVTASVSRVEAFTRNNNTYYKLFLFVGYDDTSSYINGNFTVTPSTRCASEVEITTQPSSVVTVDSTVGFEESGSFNYQQNKIFYSEKTINQFLGCYTEEGTVNLEKTFPIISSGIYFGYENGDETKKVEMRFTGVLSDIIFDLQIDNLKDKFIFEAGDEVFVKSIGEEIKNPQTISKTKTEIFANVWSYNTSCRFQIDTNSINEGGFNQFEIFTEIYDKSNIKISDKIEILERDNQIIIPLVSNLFINDINGREIIVSQDIKSQLLSYENTGLNFVTKDYDFRRIADTASIDQSSISTLKYGNDVLLSNVLNLYQNKNSIYVASNSLPDYSINPYIYSYDIIEFSSGGFNSDTGKYSIIELDREVSFLNGDRVRYTFTDQSIDGLSSDQFYYVRIVSSNRKQIKLYSSISLIDSDNNVEFKYDFSGNLPSGNHKITISYQSNLQIYPQKLLRKFEKEIDLGSFDPVYSTPIGAIGMLNNGVEIISFKTNDKIFYGPIEDITILNSGSGYDAINLPLFEVSTGNAKIQPIIQGSIEKILVSIPDFDVTNVTATLTGGNGEGAILDPILKQYQREVLFDARTIGNGGGLDVNTDTISFLENHNFFNGQEIIYSSLGNQEIGITEDFAGSNIITGDTLVSESVYVTQLINEKTIILYNNLTDYSSGINTIGITTLGNSGIQQFKTFPVNTLSEINVTDGGFNYTNRKLRVKTSGISTSNYTFNYQNHGFLDGEIVEYRYEDTEIETSSEIVGLSTINNYYIIKLDDNSFQLSDAGIGATITENYDRRKIVKFTSKGEGYQIIKYPEISLKLSYSLSGVGTDFNGSIDATPIVRGSIIDAYVYEGGSDYGSTILNLKSTPDIVIKTGKEAQFTPIIENGQIVKVIVLFGGSEYYSYPDIVVNSSSGSGANLKPFIENGRIISVEILSSGISYNLKDTSIIAIPAGSNFKSLVNIRGLDVNSAFKYGKYERVGISDTIFYRRPGTDIAVDSLDGTLQYSIVSYSSDIASKFNDESAIELSPTSFKHSPIIGWSYDSVPIYGPYGHEDPDDITSDVRKLLPGYVKNTIFNRPNIFSDDFFVDDFVFDGSGDLDKYNGRFCKTPEFPNGTYAYFATIEEDAANQTNVGKFPYFIGDKFRNYFDTDAYNSINQEFDFNNSDLIRNTLPYKVNDKFAGNDFIVESNELVSQKVVIESTKSSKINGFEIINSGDNYKVDDRILFKESEVNIIAKVSEISGESISSITTTIDLYENAILTWESNKIIVNISPFHNFESGDTINLSGLSTDLFKSTGDYKVKGINPEGTVLRSPTDDAITTGIVTTIGLYEVPPSISVGSSITIDEEIVSVLRVYEDLGALQILRSSSGIAHSEGSVISIIPNSFEIDRSVDKFDSRLNSLIYFNPQQSTGIGTTSGITETFPLWIDNVLYLPYVTTQSIFIPNHNLKTNQRVILRKPPGASGFTVRDEPDSASFSLLSSDEEILYIINQSLDYVGFVTDVGLSTITNGLYFITSGDDNFQYSIETDYVQETANIERIRSTLYTTEPHNLQDNDSISLNLENQSSGIVSFRYIESLQTLITNEQNISSGISSGSDIFFIYSHDYSDGEKVYYSSVGQVAAGLETGVYYISKLDDDRFKLSETEEDVKFSPPISISIGNTIGGSNQTLSKINPRINVFEGDDLVVDTSNSSLIDYEFKIYYDKNYEKEFISLETDDQFTITGIGTIGYPGSSITLSYSEDLPKILYYNLEKGGFISTSDKTSENYSEIFYRESKYLGTYNVYNTFGIGSTSFNISLTQRPESLFYDQQLSTTLSYNTSSKNASGSIEKIKIFAPGNEFDFIPTFAGIDTNLTGSSGSGGVVFPLSAEIGDPEIVRIIKNGFDYPYDRTVRPIASIPSSITIKNNYIIDDIQVISGGNKYLSNPNVVIIDPETLEVVSDGIVRSELSGLTVGSIIIEESPKGLSPTPVLIRTINNTNGISISQVESSSSGIVTCILTTPLDGFGEDPFQFGDQIFVEGIEKNDSVGDGFNSTDYNYQFFDVISYTASNPAILEYSLSGLTTNPGIAKTIQDSFATIINSIDYPEFLSVQSPAIFSPGEKIFSDIGFGFQERDLIVANSSTTSLRLFGTYSLTPNEIIRGSSSFYKATITNIKTSSGFFNVSAYSSERIGWIDDIGKTSEDFQVLPDNDYYQNLSYSIKSDQKWDTIVSTVNELLHTSGLKNFATTEFTQSVKAGPYSGIGTANESLLLLLNDNISETRVDTINNFDLSVDINIITDP